jgi:hypothetical protein
VHSAGIPGQAWHYRPLAMAEPPKLHGPHAPIIDLKTYDCWAVTSLCPLLRDDPCLRLHVNHSLPPSQSGAHFILFAPLPNAGTERRCDQISSGSVCIGGPHMGPHMLTLRSIRL